MAVLAVALLTLSMLADSSSPGPFVKSYYFELQNQSQVWVDLSPGAIPALGVAPLNVTVTFPGRVLKSPPDHVALRVYTGLLDHISDTADLRIISDGQARDLTAPGRDYRSEAACNEADLGCGTGAFRLRGALVTSLSFAEFQQIANASVVTVEALGTELRLTPADLAALRRLVAMTSQPLTIQYSR